MGVDYGYFTETEKLPVRGLTFTDTGDFAEQNHHTLGPFLCYKG